MGQQAIKALHLHLRVLGTGLAHHGNALVQVEHGLFMMTCCHRHNDLAKQLRRTAHHIFMAQRDGVESSGIDGDQVLAHGVQSPWKFIGFARRLRAVKAIMHLRPAAA